MGKNATWRSGFALLRTSDACRIAKRSGGKRRRENSVRASRNGFENLSARKSDHALVELVLHVLREGSLGCHL